MNLEALVNAYFSAALVELADQPVNGPPEAETEARGHLSQLESDVGKHVQVHEMEVGHEENGSGEDVIHLLIAEVLQLSLQFLIVCVREYARVFVEVADGVLLQRVLRFQGVVLADPD